MEPKKILIAVDASENAQRATEYVTEIIGKRGEEFFIELIYVISNKAKDIFPDEESWEKKKQEEVNAAKGVLANHKKILLNGGIAAKNVDFKIIETRDISIAKSILNYQKEHEFGTIVVGRRGMSKAEEFLFGSVSNKIVHYAKDCAVWVVE